MQRVEVRNGQDGKGNAAYCGSLNRLSWSGLSLVMARLLPYCMRTMPVVSGA